MSTKDHVMAAASADGVNSSSDFEAFFGRTERPLRLALIAKLGPDRGRDAAAEALAWAFETWPRALGLTRPIPYLVRVGTSRTRRRKVPVLERSEVTTSPTSEPELGRALKSLSIRQREAVVLVDAYGWSLREVAEATGRSISSVNTHHRRGLARLRQLLGESND